MPSSDRGVLMLAKKLYWKADWWIGAHGPLWRDLGLFALADLFVASASVRRGSKVGPAASNQLRTVSVRGVSSPVHYRPWTSDVLVLRNVLYAGDYGCVSSESNVRLIIDCGANIGCSALYFLHRYPDASVVCVEPDPSNFDVLRRNLEPYGERVKLVHGAVRSQEAKLALERGSYRDGMEWSIQVREPGPGRTGDIPACTVTSLMARVAADRIDLLKIDIEGAEHRLFASGTGAWLSKTRTLVIELHDDDCARVVDAAVEPYLVSKSTAGGLTVYRLREGS